MFPSIRSRHAHPGVAPGLLLRDIARAHSDVSRRRSLNVKEVLCLCVKSESRGSVWAWPGRGGRFGIPVSSRCQWQKKSIVSSWWLPPSLSQVRLRILSWSVKRRSFQMRVREPFELTLLGRGIRCTLIISVVCSPKLGNHLGGWEEMCWIVLVPSAPSGIPRIHRLSRRLQASRSASLTSMFCGLALFNVVLFLASAIFLQRLLQSARPWYS